MHLTIIDRSIKCIGCGIVSFAIIYIITKHKFPQIKIIDILMLSLVIAIIFGVIEYLYNKQDSGVSCNTNCAITEHMGNTNPFSQSQLLQLQQLIQQTPPNLTPQDIQSQDTQSQDTQSQDTQSQDIQSQDIQSQDTQSQDTQSQDTQSQDIKTRNTQSYDIQLQNIQSQDNPNIKRNTDGSYTYNVIRDPQIEFIGTRTYDGVVNDEMKYTHHDLSILPNTANTGSFENGYSMLPPDRWYPTPPHPPVCVTEKQCPVCPSYSSSQYMDLKEWNESRRITPPDNINTQYIKEKLNSGR